jgi:hypothetical protein
MTLPIEARSVTRGLFPAHLHLGWYDVTGSRGEAESGAMNTYPLLEWIKANGGAGAGGSDARYCEASSPRPVPSTGQGDWPASEAPGVRPNLDTSSSDPSLVVQNVTRTRTTPAKTGAPARRRHRAPLSRPPASERERGDRTGGAARDARLPAIAGGFHS